MAPLERLLSPGERVHLDVREHGLVLARPFARALVALLVAGGAARLLAGTAALPQPLRVGVALVAGAALAAELLRLVGAVARWHRRRLVVTDRKALLVGDGRRSSAVALASLDEVEIVRSPTGRLLHVGGVAVSVRGRRGLLFGLRRLRDPDLVLALLLGLADDARPALARRGRVRPGVPAR